MRSYRMRAFQAAAICFAIGLWALCAATNLLDSSVLPNPLEVGGEALKLLPTSGFWQAIGETLGGAFLGFGCAALTAIPLGLFTGMNRIVADSTRILLDMGRSFPVVALMPVLILLLGGTTEMKATAVFIACFFPLFVQAFYGARRIDPVIYETVLAYRIPGLLRFTRVTLPSALPFIATGIRIAATISILVAISVELVSLAPGMGREIALDRSYGAAAPAFAYIFYAGLLGIALNAACRAAEARLLVWHQRRAGES